MSSRTGSARLLPFASLVLLVAAPAASLAATLPETLADASTGVTASRPSTQVPVAPLPLPSMAPLRFVAGAGPFAFVVPSSARQAVSFAPVFRPHDGADYPVGGFSVRLLSRMNVEARRYRDTNVSSAAGALRHDTSFELDSIDEATRSAAASRVIMRSSHRAFSDELERLGRTSFGLGAALDRLQNFSFHRSRPDAADEASSRRLPDEPAGIAQAPDRLRGDIGLRLDAHPALMFRARLGSLHGRIDLPVRNEPVRLTLESPVGARGHAVLSSGLPRDGQGWATLTFSFGF